MWKSFKNILEKSEYLINIFPTTSIEAERIEIGTEVAGVKVNHNIALTLPAVFAAITIKAENMGSLPKKVYEKTNKGLFERKNHPVYKLIHQPNPIMNAFTFWEKMEGKYWV